MWHNATSRIKRVAGSIIEEIRDRTHVDVGEPEQSPREISGIVVSPEDRTELFVEDALDFVAQFIPLLHPLFQFLLGFRAAAILMIFDQGSQHL